MFFFSSFFPTLPAPVVAPLAFCRFLLAFSNTEENLVSVFSTVVAVLALVGLSGVVVTCLCTAAGEGLLLLRMMVLVVAAWIEVRVRGRTSKGPNFDCACGDMVNQVDGGYTVGTGVLGTVAPWGTTPPITHSHKVALTH